MPRSTSVSRCALRALLAAIALSAIALPATASAEGSGPAQSAPAAASAPAAVPAPAPTPPLPYPIAPLTVAGPFDSTLRLEIYDRLRGELVDWFGTPPDGPTRDFRYNFLGNKLQLGVRWTRDPYEAFVQFQNSTLANVPEHGVGIGQTYFANTMSTTQNGAILRQGWAGV